ncbi:MAG: hypothetical protein OR997_00905 [Methylophilaceae bacterium]|jgi:hypothetical protein|nr:hypothetical protein [Methylophilaceae bacterium]
MAMLVTIAAFTKLQHLQGDSQALSIPEMLQKAGSVRMRRLLTLRKSMRLVKGWTLLLSVMFLSTIRLSLVMLVTLGCIA